MTHRLGRALLVGMAGDDELVRVTISMKRGEKARLIAGAKLADKRRPSLSAFLVSNGLDVCDLLGVPEVVRAPKRKPK